MPNDELLKSIDPKILNVLASLSMEELDAIVQNNTLGIEWVNSARIYRYLKKKAK